MKIRLKRSPSGLINGAPWPAAGEVVDLPDVVAESLLGDDTAELVEPEPAPTPPPTPEPTPDPDQAPPAAGDDATSAGDDVEKATTDDDAETATPPADVETATTPADDVETATPARRRRTKRA